MRLAPLSEPQESGQVLTSIEPGKVSTVMVARIFNQNGQLVPNVNIKLKADVEPKSGGHGHHDNSRPKGQLSNGISAGIEVTGNTGSDGMVFTFRASAPAGDHTIAATCTDANRACTQEGADTVSVEVKELFPLSDSTVYTLIKPNADTFHPDNHYLTATAAQRVAVLGALYHGKFPDDPVLHLNDASLERGGVFDFKKRDWTPPHSEHRRGTVIDIRANDASGAIPQNNKRKFEELVKDVIGGNLRHEYIGTTFEHYHVRLLGVAE